MDNVNPPLTLKPPVLPTALRVKVVQELDKLQAILAYIDSPLENVKHFLNGFVNPPNEINMDDLKSGDESIDTPLVSLFVDSNDDSNDGEVLNELEEYGNAGKLSLGWLLEEIHVTWANLEKKRTRLQLCTNLLKKMRTAAGDGITFIREDVRAYKGRRQNFSDGVRIQPT
uniref:Uncharacterized protein n=1 Tax=Tanacetum cinerariifolium TaxID=118510 RepID=A0A699GJN0_TANCI|nr:hypothetical protein [Tanacetum cinerariifolium]